MSSQRLPHALLTLALLAAIGDAAAGALREQVERAAQQNFAEYLDALRIPNVPAQASDIQRNADFMSRAFERRGFDVRLVTNAAEPAGRARGARAAARPPYAPLLLSTTTGSR